MNYEEQKFNHQDPIDPKASQSGYVPPVGYPGGVIPPPVPPTTPNPGLAALLGFIPGVGAMYNGQLVKGLVHIGIFAVLVSLSSDVNGVFGLFVAGWIFYQVIEAYQTAVARRNGMPLPNPFGLNDLGDRIGFGPGQSWPGAGPQVPPYTPPYAPPYTPPGNVPPGYTAPGYVPPGYVPPVAPGYVPPANPYSADPAYGASPYTPPPPPPPPPEYGYAPPVVPPVIPPPDANSFASRFPTGAIWMIGLGLFFLVTHTHGVYVVRGSFFLPLLFIALGVWMFVQRSGILRMANDGSAAYRWNLLLAARRSGWLILIGVIFLLQSLHIVRWGSVWPLFLIYLGLWAIAERFMAQQMAAESYAASAPIVPPVPPSGTSIVPSPEFRDPGAEAQDDRNGEGR